MTSNKPALDFSFLRQCGIDMLQRLSGETWTDYNLHDPGITILEALCYAITDLAYRTGFPIADLLCDETGVINLTDNSFFGKEYILTTNPVTVNDFRKAILDEMDELYNVWLEPVTSAYAYDTVGGLYTIVAQVKKEIADRFQREPAFESELKKKLLRSFVSKRNIGEDVVQAVIALKPVMISIKAEIIINGEEIPETILATIYRELEAAINPPVRYYTEGEMLKKGFSVEEIYTGPLLKKGFVPDEELDSRKREIDPAELVKVISQVKGVVYVKNLLIITPAGKSGKAPYILGEVEFPFFDDSLVASPIRLFNDKYEVYILESIFREICIQVQEKAKRSFVQALNRLSYQENVQGKYRNIGYYHSIQHLFPIIYGISEEGLPAGESPARKAQAKQLKAYLLFFEQILAGYLAQLANMRNLFSVENAGKESQTYYYQPLYNVPGIKDLLKAFTDNNTGGQQKDWEEFIKNTSNVYIQALKKGSETDDQYLQRRNSLLDHLLARFNEQLINYPITVYNLLYNEAEATNKDDYTIAWKTGILKNIVSLTHDRMKGFDYLQGEKTADISGFGKKMAALLYINNYPARSLTSEFSSNNLHVVPAHATEATSLQGEKDVEEMTYRKELLTVISDDEMNQMINEQMIEAGHGDEKGHQYHFKQQKTSFFRFGIDAGNYKIGRDIKGNGYLLMFKEPAAKTWQVISRHPDESSSIQALKKLVAYLKKISTGSEGFYLVEHILLRPLLHTSSFGFRFHGSQNNILLQHSRWATFSERERAIAEILKAVNTGNDSNLKTWATIAAGADFENISYHLRMYENNKLRFFPKFEMLLKGEGEQFIQEEMFSFTMTVVLPGWPARFNDDNFRLFLEDMFRLNAPAHLKIHFQWLNISRMQTFEKLYAGLTAALQNMDDNKERTHYTEKLITFLYGHKYSAG